MSEWPLVPIGELCELYDGPHQTAPLAPGGPVVYLNVGDIRGGRIELALSGQVTEETARKWSRRVEPLPGDVVFGYEAKVGEAAMLTKDHRWCLGRRVGLLRPRSGLIDSRYLTYAWYSKHFQDTLRAHRIGGTTIESIRLTDLPRWTIPLPSIDRQRRIAGTLGALDDKIELNRRMSETLEGTAQALFKSWFLDSEPDASDEDGSLADAVDLLRDLVDPQLEPDTVFHHYSLPAYDAGREAISEPGAGIRSSKLAVPWGSVLLSKLNPEIERVWVPDIRPDDRAICSTEFLVLRPRADVGRAFVYEFLRSAPFRSTLTSLVTGTTGSHQRAHAEAILQVPLRLPGPSQAAKFELVVGLMLDRVAVARRESRTLVALRDALLPRLLSGETSPSFGGGQGA
ncbi:MAG: restriction endonuclease subunit S [Chloroflexi bacterium]|nr:restriction endonuclease subunit S [Chloroflexota bacterium]